MSDKDDPFMRLLRLQQRTAKKFADLQRKMEAQERFFAEEMEASTAAMREAGKAIDHLQKVVDSLREKNNLLLGEIVQLEVSIDLRDRPSRN